MTISNAIILSTKEDAQRVLDALAAVIRRFRVATQADLYALIDQPSHVSDHEWGWTNTNGFSYTEDAEGWRLIIPKSIQLPSVYNKGNVSE